MEGVPTAEQLAHLAAGVDLGDFISLPATVRMITAPGLWPRNPPIRERKSIPDSWLELTIREGKNRQVRRMTAKVGLPTLRLVRVKIGEWQLDGLLPGEMRRIQVAAPPAPPQATVRRNVPRRPVARNGKR